MSNEFLKGSALIPAKTGKLAKASEYNTNLATIAKDSFIGSDADGVLSDVDVGDETLGTVGYVVKDLKVRESNSLKLFDITGNLINSALWGNILTASFIDKYAINGLIPSSNTGTPDEQVDVTTGRCIAEDEATILSLSSLTTADLTNHITPGNNTTYHLFLYRNASTQLDVLDFTTSLTPTAGAGDAQLPNLDLGKLRRVGSVITDGTADIIAFYSEDNNGNITVKYETQITDSTAEYTVATDTVISVPTGIRVGCMSYFYITTASSTSTSLFLTDQTSGAEVLLSTMKYGSGGNSSWDAPYITFTKTDTLGQVKYRVSNVSLSSLSLRTFGFIDYRNNY